MRKGRQEQSLGSKLYILDGDYHDCWAVSMVEREVSPQMPLPLRSSTEVPPSCRACAVRFHDSLKSSSAWRRMQPTCRSGGCLASLVSAIYLCYASKREA